MNQDKVLKGMFEKLGIGDKSMKYFLDNYNKPVVYDLIQNLNNCRTDKDKVEFLIDYSVSLITVNKAVLKQMKGDLK